MSSTEVVPPEVFTKNLDMLCCPGCGGGLHLDGNTFGCNGCAYRFESDNRIVKLFWANDWGPVKKDITEIERSFYEENPFPNYDDADTVATLDDKARAGI